jgi:hypothetical protein
MRSPVLALPLLALSMAAPMPEPPVTFNLNFPGASLGTIEALAGDRFRLHVAGQTDERGHNRQATWYYFRMDRVRGRDLVLTLTDLVGEYNDRPGAVAMNADTVPVFSSDGKRWQHVPAMEWDDRAKEATLRLRPETDSLWVAHIPPYVPEDLERLLADVDRSPHARIEVIGKSVQGRDLRMVTVTDAAVPDRGKLGLWIQARQHAWEAGTSQVMEGALRFITSEHEAARDLRRKVLFRFLPMGDPDGCAAGKVRFNANGYDVNRHWDAVDLRRKDHLALMPEIWYVRKALAASAGSGEAVDLLLNLHNTETAEYLATAADTPYYRELLTRLQEALVARTSFHPSRGPTFQETGGTMSALWGTMQVPVVLLELRIGTNTKLGRRPTVADRLRFGEQLVIEAAQALAAGPPR